MHPILGIPILLVVLFIIYLLVGRFGAGTCVDFLQESVFNRYLIPWTKAVLDMLLPSDFLKDFLVGEFGIFTMALTYAIAIVLPIVGFFFLAFGILEDSGYLPRLAVMSNKIFRLMGLNGRAVLPMVLGLGCATMATLTTRILDTKKERLIVTFLLALGVPCSAQLGVILGLLGGLSFAATAIWAGVVLFVLIFMGHLSSKVVKGKEADFILELPPIRMPQLSNILYKTRIRIAWYLREAVPLFVIGTVILFAADKTGALVWLEKLARPLVVHVLNLPSEVSAAFFVGFLRRDYGAVFLMDAAKAGNLDGIQIVVSLVTITLFVPCIANFFMMIKERGLKAAFVMVLIILPFSFGLGGIVNLVLRTFNVAL
jgi:ferrous iron transport protein B